MKSCETCRWAGCSNYGKKLSSCEKYIMSLEEAKRIEINKKQIK